MWMLKDIYFVIYGIISEFTGKGQFHYLTKLNTISFAEIKINILS